MLTALYVKSGEKEKKVTFFTENQLDRYVEKHIGKNRCVAITDNDLQIIMNRESIANGSRNIFVRSKDGNILLTKGDLIITCLGLNGEMVVDAGNLSTRFATIKENQNQLFEEWFEKGM